MKNHAIDSHLAMSSPAPSPFLLEFSVEFVFVFIFMLVFVILICKVINRPFMLREMSEFERLCAVSYLSSAPAPCPRCRNAVNPCTSLLAVANIQKEFQLKM